PHGVSASRPIIAVERETKQNFVRAGLLSRKLGHFFNPRQRGHWAGRAGTPMLIIRHDDDSIAGVSQGGQIEGPRPVTVGPILCLPGDGNGQDRKSTRLNSSHEWISY